jgi:hypothetical protein
MTRVRANRLTALTLGVGLLVSACVTDPTVHAQSPAIVQKRTAATASAETALAKFTPIGRVLGTSSSDWCATGQDNWAWHDTVKYSCALTRSALVAPTATSGPQSATDVLNAFARAGCGIPRGMVADPSTEGLFHGVGGPAAASCGDVYVSISWYVDPQEATRSNNTSGRPAGGFDVEFTPLAPSALDQIATTKPVTWWISADIGYVEEK